MRCDSVRDILMDYVAEELPEKISWQVREHLAMCERCRNELEMARKASDFLTMLGHREETELVIRVPDHTAKVGLPFQRRVHLQLVGALLVAVVCIVGIGALRSLKRTPPVVRVEQPVVNRNKSVAQILPVVPDQPPIAMDAGRIVGRSVRGPRHRRFTSRNDSIRTQRHEKPAVAGGVEKPVDAIVERSPTSMPPQCGLAEGAMMMVSVSWPSRKASTDDSYSYQYRECDPKSGTSIECQASRRGESIEIRMHGKSGGELARGELYNEPTVEIDCNLLVSSAVRTDLVCGGSEPN